MSYIKLSVRQMQAHPKIASPPQPNSTWYRPNASQRPELITHPLIYLNSTQVFCCCCFSFSIPSSS